MRRGGRPLRVCPPSARKGGALSPPAALRTERADVGIGPYFTLQDLGIKASPNRSTAYLSVIPEM